MGDFFKIEPFLINKPWGGGHLDKLRSEPGAQSIGEAALVSTVEAFPTMISSGRYRNTVFRDYWLKEGQARAEQCGFISPGHGDLPFLIKILSTREPLSIQVHPSDDDLEKLGLTGHGKFESWVLLEVEKGAELYLGLKEGHDFNELKTIETLENPLEIFKQYNPAVGDIFILNPGLIHGTRGRLLFYEIQQPSDYTFRIFDFGRDRELHLSNAIAVSRNIEVQKGNWENELHCPAFNVKVLAAREGSGYSINNPFEVVSYFGPSCSLKCGHEEVSISWGDTLFFFRGSSFNISFSMREEDSRLPLMNENDARFFFASPA